MLSAIRDAETSIGRQSLWSLTAGAGLSPVRRLSDADGEAALAGLAGGSSLEAGLDAFRGRTVLISCVRQLPAALALLQLDGVARRVLLCPPDFPPAYLPEVLQQAAADVIVSDGSGPASVDPAGPPVIACKPGCAPGGGEGDRDRETEWLLFTSGTTGRPKLVSHRLASLTGPHRADSARSGGLAADGAVWSTFYDIRRYGGLQILLRALLGGGSMVLSQAGEGVAAFLGRAGRQGVSHMSGTPSHWRRALMSGASGLFSPRYVRLSGEVADQAILDQLRAAFPDAAVVHAFASTEAGVAFDVRDGLAGFPAALLEQPGGAEMRIRDGSLQIRSGRTASGYLGATRGLADADGFVDTGDMVERRGDRLYFAGRREGVVNVGGLKVYPEEVEAVINQHPAVQMARVRGRASPITGAIVEADIVLRDGVERAAFEAVRREVLEACQRALPAYKVPTRLIQAASLEVTGAGKLARAGA